jgi:hypothetical protein
VYSLGGQFAVREILLLFLHFVINRKRGCTRRQRGELMPSRTRLLLVSVMVSAVLAVAPQTITAQARRLGSAPRGIHGGILTPGGHHPRLTRGEHRRSGFLFYPGFDYFDDDYDRNYEPPEVSHNVAMEPPNAATATSTKPVESLLLENRGGQWVRILSAGQMPVAQGYVEPAASSSGAGATGSRGSPKPPDKLPPAVLVFRDGHEELVNRYIMQGSVLYTSSNYWSTGCWTREIPIAKLDVPATVKRNAERGGVFSLPTSRNEVVVRF